MSKSETTIVNDNPSPDAGTDLEIRSSTDLAQLDELRQILLSPNSDIEITVPDVATDPDEISREIMARLMDATSEDELEMPSPLSWRDELEGVPLLLKGFSWRPSTFRNEDGSPQGQKVFFVVFAERLDTGESIVTTTGSGNVLAQLVGLAKLNLLPGAIRMLVRSGKETTRGFRPLKLVTPPEVLERRRSEHLSNDADATGTPADPAAA